VAAAGILCALFAALTLLPALMALLGRAAFWPFRPKLLPETQREPALVTGLEGQKGLWRATGSLVARRPRTVWVGSVLLLLVAGAGLLQLKANGVAQTDVILTASNAVDGQEALGRHFDAGSGSPAVIVTDETTAGETRSGPSGNSRESRPVIMPKTCTTELPMQVSICGAISPKAVSGPATNTNGLRAAASTSGTNGRGMVER